MTILLQVDIFPSILKKLPLNDLIILRRVCYQWKEWIDDYLKRQKILLLTFGINYKRLSGRSQTLNIDYSKIILHKLVLNLRCLTRKWSGPKYSVARSLVRMFPNLEELYIFTWQKRAYYNEMNYETMLRGWKSTLKKLIIPDLLGSHISGIMKCLTECRKLETLGIYNEDLNYGNEILNRGLHIESEQVLSRLTSLWISSSEWEYFQDHVTNIAAIHDYTDFKSLPSDRFLNIQRIYKFMYFSSGEENKNLCEFLQKLAQLEHKMLCSLEFKIRCYCMSWLDDPYYQDKVPWPCETFEESRYPLFFAEMNRFPGVKTLKFELEHRVFLEYVLRCSADFDHVETLIINYRYADWTSYSDDNADDKGILQLPLNFLELLPKKAKRVRNMEFHLESQICDNFRRADFSNFPYKVKILHVLGNRSPGYWNETHDF